MNRRFIAVRVVWDIHENVSMSMTVTGYRQPHVPAIPASRNDPGAPAEGGELEDMRLFCGARLEKELEDRLLADESFMQAVQDRVEKVYDR